MYCLAWDYEHGEGVEASLPLAAHWYEQASEAGDAEASRCLGVAV
mgnify:CR=1 FL=1